MVRPPGNRSHDELATGRPWPIEVRTLGSFQILHHGEPLRFERKTPKRALQLLKALIAFGGRDVARERLADALWPDASGDRSINALNTTIGRLRRLMNEPDAITLVGGRLTLNPDLCRVDAFVFERLMDGVAEVEPEDPDAQVERALDLYRGGFLDDEPDASWALSMRARLRRKFVLAIERRAHAYELSGDVAAAIRLSLRGIDVDEVAEEFYRQLMRCYEKLGRRAEAMSIFRQLHQTLSATLGIRPSRESQGIFESLRNGQMIDHS